MRDSTVARGLLGVLLLWLGLTVFGPMLVRGRATPPRILSSQERQALQQLDTHGVALMVMPMGSELRENKYLAPLRPEYDCLLQGGIPADEAQRRLRWRYRLGSEPGAFNEALSLADRHQDELPTFDYDRPEHCDVLVRQWREERMLLPLPLPLVRR